MGSPDGRSGSGILVARERDTPPQKPLVSPDKDLRALAHTVHPYNWTERVVGAIVGGNVGVTRDAIASGKMLLSLRNGGTPVVQG